MPVVAVRLAPSLHKAFIEHCEKADKSPTDVLRAVVERIVDGLDDAQEEERQDRRTRPLLKAPVALRDGLGPMGRAMESVGVPFGRAPHAAGSRLMDKKYKGR